MNIHDLIQLVIYYVVGSVIFYILYKLIALILIELIRTVATVIWYLFLFLFVVYPLIRYFHL